jgi:hypothetical protein
VPDLNFEVIGAEAVTFAAAPLLNLKLRLTNADAAELIQSVMLRCQIHLEVTRRQYNAEEKARMFELFGEPERWGQTLKTMLWTHAAVVVPPFTESTTIDLPVPCTFDFNVAATKFFGGLDGGEVPLNLLFSGTIFYQDDFGSLQISQISWEKEASYLLPVKIWQEMMEHYYPNSAWLGLRRDVFERLKNYKMGHGFPTWEQALEKLLLADEAEIKKSVSL